MNLNWDAACNKPQKTIGLGAIMSDHDGQVLRTMCVKKSIATSPFTAEAMGLFEAILFCKNAGFSNLLLEGDTLQVVKLMQMNSEDWSEGGCLIKDSKHLLQSFTLGSIQHTPRNNNIVANSLAQLALTIFSYVYLLDGFLIV